MIYEVVGKEKSSRTSDNIFHITKTPKKNQKFASTNDISPDKTCVNFIKALATYQKRIPKAAISKRNSRVLRKVAAIIKIILSQDTTSLDIVLTIIKNLNEDLIKLMIRKRKYFIGLLSEQISKKELQMIE